MYPCGECPTTRDRTASNAPVPSGDHPSGQPRALRCVIRAPDLRYPSGCDCAAEASVRSMREAYFLFCSRSQGLGGSRKGEDCSRGRDRGPGTAGGRFLGLEWPGRYAVAGETGHWHVSNEPWEGRGGHCDQCVGMAAVEWTFVSHRRLLPSLARVVWASSLAGRTAMLGK